LPEVEVPKNGDDGFDQIRLAGAVLTYDDGCEVPIVEIDRQIA
jgi:hypothetical protein